MSTTRVMEFIRDPSGVWSLPQGLMEGLRRDFPQVEFVSPADRAGADAALPDTEIVFGYAVRAENFASARALRWIQITSAGVGPALFPELVASDVQLTNGRGLYSDAMAEHALGLMLAFARQLHLARDAQHDRRWAHAALRDESAGFRTLSGTTLGLVGFGSIGQALARRARALDMRVIALRRHPSDDPAPADVQWGTDRLDALLEQADWLVLSPPLTSETRGMIGAHELARVKRGAILVNLGRGALIDEAALAQALADGRVAGAGLDVFQTEPLPEASPLWSAPNVIVTPHVSGLAPGLWERAVAMFARNLRAYLEGRPLENVVDKRAGY
jgi:phosphoglycerate dehydrogenase-like enzyme